MKKFPLDKNTFIQGWYIDPKICDSILNGFKEVPSFAKFTSSLEKGNPKDSLDTRVDKYNFFPPFNKYRLALQKCLEDYVKLYPDLLTLNRFDVSESYNIQYYKKGEGFKIWHSERQEVKFSDRLLVFMTYLNNVKDGGTMFKYQNLTIPAKKGLTLIWPSDWTHTHKGQISHTKEKYIITGWYSYE